MTNLYVIEHNSHSSGKNKTKRVSSRFFDTHSNIMSNRRKLYWFSGLLKLGSSSGRALFLCFIWVASICLFGMFSLLNHSNRLLESENSFLIVGHYIDNQYSSMKNNAMSTGQHTQVPDIWTHPHGEGYYKCIGRTGNQTRKENATNGYLLVNANGGLNQMKIGISDMVVVAKLINATLVIPSLDHKSYWNDSSKFQDIFDYKHFKEYLKNEVEIVESIPEEYKSIKPFTKAPVSWSKPGYYKGEIAALLKKHKVLNFTHADSRLSNNAPGPSVQRLRCRAMYEGLKFNPKIEELAKTLVERLRSNSENYIALHLRYEKDMLAFSGCDHSLTKIESKELRTLRYKTRHWKDKEINGMAKRLDGLCPMTPREVGVFLEAMGYPSSTKIYIAAGKAYGSNGDNALKAKYPNLLRHSNLATEKELQPFKFCQNQLAAIDYIVSLQSDVFIYTYDGNMAKAVQGHRKFEGFRKTIDPNKHKFVRLIDKLDAGEISWEKFSLKVRSLHLNRTGRPEPRLRGHSPKAEENFYANPFPGCICQGSKEKNTKKLR